uniref:Sodium/hydrogen exchanger (TC.KEF) n=1 Tax=uncultured marine thaumarchaeote AD1000_77_H06 TaxID=1455940 RepID=A0A075FYE8_9ARCH|nr:sodium/hydrogen exchanger (TC.KEF) [uncultured marine thaumarchaeote AD1000_77_H06]
MQLPHETFVTDLAIIMILAAIVTLAFFKIRQPLIIGYLFAGMLIGPLSPLWTSILPQNGSSGPAAGIGILSDISALNLFADIGIILLLFVIGIEFPFAKIRSIGKVAMGAGTLGLFLTLGVVFLAASALGLNFMDSLFIAAALSISSTAVIVKILQDSGKIKKESSILILGILIVEDVIAVILIASLESIALAGTVSIEGVILVAVVAAGLIVGTFTIGRRVIPLLIDKVASAQNREILLLSVLGVCFGYALLANVVGLSVAIGAFLAGVLVAESKSAEVSKILSSPIKDMFVAIFFVSVGALMDITQLESYIFIAIALIAVTTAMKFGGNLLGNTVFRLEKGKSLRSAFALSAPRGEFSIVIVKVGVDMGVVSAFLFPLIGLITIITAFMSPFLIRLGDKIIPKLSKS